MRGKAGHLGEHRVDRGHHRRRQTTRHVGAEAGRIEIRAQKIRRRVEHPRLAAAEAVDRLLGVTHHEHGHGAVGAARLGEPTRQRLPLQRIGVLEFVEQQMLVARVQLERQRRRMLLAGEQAAGEPLGIGKVDHALLRLGVLIAGEQRVAEQQAVAVEGPDALVGLDRGKGFERGFQRVEVTQVGVQPAAERFFQFFRRLLLAPLARRHQARHQHVVRGIRRQRRRVEQVARPPGLGFRAFFQRAGHPFHPRHHRVVEPECRHRIGVEIGMQQWAQLAQCVSHRLGLAVGIGPPLRPRRHEMRQQRTQIMLADIGQQRQQGRALRRLRRCSPFRQQAIAHLVL